MTAYIIRRIILMIPVLVIVGIVVFFLIHITPGDPAAVILGPSATKDQVVQLRHELGLDTPIMVQFFTWFGHAVTGDLGVSIYSGNPVTHVIATHIGPTISLTVLAFIMSIVIAIPVALLAVWKRNSFLDPTFMSISIMGVSIPNFWLALMLILLLAVKLRILPVSGYVAIDQGVGQWLIHLLLPAFVLAVQQSALVARMLRDGMLEVINQDYIRTAWAKGLGERVVLTKHAFLNAMIPTTTVIGVGVAKLLGGAVVTEQVFVIPGVGNLLVDSIARRDFPVIQGVILFTALIYVVVNLLVDVNYGVLDPRVRYD
ncbi:MAG: ABC transporter permease [Streptosporangiales bacterium]